MFGDIYTELREVYKFGLPLNSTSDIIDKSVKK